MNTVTDLSIVSLITNSSVLVQCVMLVLLGLSIISWSIIFQRRAVLKAYTRGFNNFKERFELSSDLERLYEYIGGRRETEGVESLFRAAFREFVRLHKTLAHEPAVVLDNVLRAVKVQFIREQQILEGRVAFLATIGSLSVYIGLFGTVWGIMNAFQALGTAQQATLAMVAPAISEALIATAMGLVAAIPAAFAYNRLSVQIQTLLDNYEGLTESLLNLLQRKLYTKHSQSLDTESVL